MMYNNIELITIDSFVVMQVEDEVAVRSLHRNKSTYNALRRKTVKKNSTFFDRLVVVVPPLIAETCAYLERFGNFCFFPLSVLSVFILS